MAQMFPHSIPESAPRGEIRLFHILKKLPNDCLVFHEPVIKNRRPDFVIISPAHGVKVIEVKGWYGNEIAEADTKGVTLKQQRSGQTRVARHDHPLEQARKYMFRLLDFCRNNEAALPLIQRDGPYAGRFHFPFGHIAVLSNIRRSQLKNDPRLDRIFPTDLVLTRDRLDEWEELEGEEILEQLMAFFDPNWPFPPMTSRQIAYLRWIIYPEILIEIDSPDQPHSLGDIKLLDLKQQEYAYQIGSGHRILRGVAGSGKTLILATRARVLADEDPDKKILVLCFNVTLANFLKSLFDEKIYGNVEVNNFHRFASRQFRVSFRRGETQEDFGRRFLEALSALEEPDRYDAVLIDEAQDFSESWFRCALALMKDPAGGDLLIVGDGTQKLYEIGKVSWKSIGIEAAGRSYRSRFDLHLNYRNSPEIFKLAERFGLNQAHHGVPDTGEKPARCIQRETGSHPLMMTAEDRETELNWICDTISQLLEGDLPYAPVPALRPEEIAVLSRNQNADLSRLISKMEAREMNVLWVTDPDNPRNRERINEGGIKVQTIHSAKGLQYRAVFLIMLDLIPENDGFADGLFFVGATRAEEFLFLSHASRAPLVENLRSFPEQLVELVQPV